MTSQTNSISTSNFLSTQLGGILNLGTRVLETAVEKTRKAVARPFLTTPPPLEESWTNIFGDSEDIFERFLNNPPSLEKAWTEIFDDSEDTSDRSDTVDIVTWSEGVAVWNNAAELYAKQASTYYNMSMFKEAIVAANNGIDVEPEDKAILRSLQKIGDLARGKIGQHDNVTPSNNLGTQLG